jgi:hypothetical protein
MLYLQFPTSLDDMGLSSAPGTALSRMTGSSEVVNTLCHKYHPIRTKIPQQHYHGNGYKNTFINIIPFGLKSLNRK